MMAFYETTLVPILGYMVFREKRNDCCLDDSISRPLLQSVGGKIPALLATKGEEIECMMKEPSLQKAS